MNKRIMVAPILIITISSSIGLVPGCAAPAPAPAPSPVTAPAPETLIPTNYSTYTEEGLYSISYPSDWEPALSIIEEINQEAKEIIKSEDPEIPIEQAVIIFIAGIPMEGGYMPNVNITVETFPRALTVDEYVEGGVQSLKRLMPDYYEFSRTRKDIGGRDAIILDCEGSHYTIGKFHWLQMSIVDGKGGWGVTITSQPDEFSKYEDDFHSILNSFRLLK